MASGTTQLLTFFPTFVWVHDLKPEAAGPLNDRLETAICELLAPRPEIPAGHTWQTHQDLHERPQFAELVRLVMQTARGVLEFLKCEPDPYEITGCWANVNPSGSPHAAHTHPNNFLSGVYYVRTPAGSDKIRFADPRPQIQQISPRYRERGPENSYEVFVPTPAGRLVFFPAWLQHSVPTNQASGERISIAFNIMFSDFTRKLAKPKWPGIKPADERE